MNIALAGMLRLDMDDNNHLCDAFIGNKDKKLNVVTELDDEVANIL